MRKITKTFEYGQHTVTLETGGIARQASGAVLVRMGETVVLVSAVGKQESEPRGFFPLTVNYGEKTFASGKIPGGYFKREGRPSEKEVLICRLIDRGLRPLFPKGFMCEVQIIATVLSLDPEVPSDIPAIIGASAALCLSGIPFKGPLAAARVGYADGNYLLNPSFEAIATSELDLVVSGTHNAVLMVESEADQLSESVMLGAVLYGHQQMQVAIQAMEELAKEASRPSWNWEAPAENQAVVDEVTNLVGEDIKAAYQIQEKQARVVKLDEVRQAMIKKLCDATDESKPSEGDVSKCFHKLESQTVRQRILAGDPRIDGRDTETVRPIMVELGLLPRVHGSAVFTRGETQAIVALTLGAERDAQMIDNIEGDYKDPFMLHYNFPPYSVGEVGFMTGPKRREIGHGKLAKRALAAVVPTLTEFPYVLRAVSEITESNGSSSMATVCGTSLALMDAGVPIKAPVAGVAMGLIKEENKFAVLTDILADEDHLGDMDFKVAGTEQGITALQMDIKIDGITKQIMECALEQAKKGRLHILSVMNKALDKPRDALSQFAPCLLTITIHPDKIRDVIGKGGATIRELTETTNSTIDLDDTGLVKIMAQTSADAEAAKARIEEITADVEVGKIYDGAVVKIVDFGAFVSVLPGKEGLLHISEIQHERVESVHDHLEVAQKVRVKVVEVDRQGRVRLSIKQIQEPA